MKSVRDRDNLNRPLVQWKFLQLKKYLKKAAPSPCFLQSCTQIGSKMLIYGGCDTFGIPLSQIFLFDTKTYQWSGPGDSVGFDDHPGARYGHTATLVDMHPPRILVYGGMVGSKTYEFDAPDSIDSPVGDAASASSAFTFLTNRRKGRNRTGAFEEPDEAVYFLELTSDSWSWTRPLINKGSGVKPLPRVQHSANKINSNEIVVFGGWTDQPSGELWIFNFVDLEWRLPVTSGILPRPRYRHTSEVLMGKLFVLGGSDTPDDNTDGARHLAFHELNLETMTWSHPELRGGNPFPRSGHCSSVVGAKSIVVFGGKRNDEVFFNDTIIIDTETYSMTTVRTVENAMPTPINSASIATMGNTFYVFGGTSSDLECYNDIRSLDIGPYLDSSDITVGEGSASDYSFKVLIIGDASVGKSAILTRFAENVFLSNYTATIGIDFNSRMIRVNGSICKLEIWDTAGQERFSTITANYYRGAQGALLVYDVGLKESLLHVKSWYDRAKLLGGQDIETLLVGNKADISDEERQVTWEEGDALAAELGIQFMETSALSGTNVETAFVTMTSAIKESVDRRGLGGLKTGNLDAAGGVTLAQGDRKMTMREKCGCA